MPTCFTLSHLLLQVSILGAAVRLTGSEGGELLGLILNNTYLFIQLSLNFLQFRLECYLFGLVTPTMDLVGVGRLDHG